jgi:hypothetical protein
MKQEQQTLTICFRFITDLLLTHYYHHHHHHHHHHKVSNFVSYEVLVVNNI